MRLWESRAIAPLDTQASDRHSLQVLSSPLVPTSPNYHESQTNQALLLPVSPPSCPVCFSTGAMGVLELQNLRELFQQVGSHKNESANRKLYF